MTFSRLGASGGASRAKILRKHVQGTGRHEQRHGVDREGCHLFINEEVRERKKEGREQIKCIQMTTESGDPGAGGPGFESTHPCSLTS